MPTTTPTGCDSVAERPTTPSFESAITTTYPHRAGASLTLAEASATPSILVRAEPGGPTATTLGVGFGSSHRRDGVLVVGQRPGEWVLLGAAEAMTTLVDTLDDVGHVSVIDHTHGRALFRLAGYAASAVLEKICSLDWSDPTTPDGAVVSGSVAKVVCDIVRDDLRGEPSYLIACDRSYGQYLFDAILDAGREFDIAVGPETEIGRSGPAE